MYSFIAKSQDIRFSPTQHALLRSGDNLKHFSEMFMLRVFCTTYVFNRILSGMDVKFRVLIPRKLGGDSDRGNQFSKRISGVGREREGPGGKYRSEIVFKKTGVRVISSESRVRTMQLNGHNEAAVFTAVVVY